MPDTMGPQPDIVRPAALSINAWTGSEVAAASFDESRLAWGLDRRSPGEWEYTASRAPGIINDWDWRHPRIGWGLVLPDNDALPPERRCSADDAPAAIQRLLAARPGSPVLRWRAQDGGVGELLRYAADGRSWRMQLTSKPGISTSELPLFLLVFAPPDRIPWCFQYAANLGRYVGRLHLDGAALDRYVDALISDWQGAQIDLRAPLVWSVDLGKPDITWLMDTVISRKIFDAWERDGDFGRCEGLFGAAATGARLVAALVANRPPLVVTTSHGMTGPLNDVEAMSAQLGMPVDASHRAIDMAALAAAWQPDGAIWYAHACCSAGSDAVSAYEGLFDPHSDVARVLRGVAAGCGARIAPLPQALLGAKRPLRAFIGQVEPTFDWTLRNPCTGQPLTHSLVLALYDKLFEGGQRRPIGWALARVFDEAATLLGQWAQACQAYNGALPRSLDAALYYQITAMDRQHTVILGDPTVSLPALTSAS